MLYRKETINIDKIREKRVRGNLKTYRIKIYITAGGKKTYRRK